jgi:hypothetical protein
MKERMKIATVAMIAIVTVLGGLAHRRTTMSSQAASVQAAGDVEQLTLPDYRQWTHVKSMVIFDPKHPLYNSFGGIHHIYVNGAGLKASQTGGRYPDGSQLVFVLYEAVNEQGAYVAGKKKVEAIMVKNRRRFAETGGWGFQAFNPETRKPLVKNADVASACFNCHAAQKDHDYVFSELVK